MFGDAAADGLDLARIVRVERSSCRAAFADGSQHRIEASPLPAVGDWVAVLERQVVEVLPRWSALTRSDPDGTTTQVLAANVDVVLVTAPADRLNPQRVERELAIAWDSGAVPVVVLAKSDVADPGAEAALRQRLAGVDVVAVSSLDGRGVEQIRQLLRPSRTAVLLGPSGAGKSTLANLLLQEEVLATGAVRENDGRGRHTTTSRHLVPIPGGGIIVDTPGLRSLGLSGDVDLGAAFPDIDQLARQCRFSDCRHEVEPGCAVIGALQRGVLDPARLSSFRKLDREMAAEARQVDPVARRAQLELWKARAKAGRLAAKRKPR